MFEKEAEEWVKENMDCCKTDNSVNRSIPYFDEEERCCAKSAFQDGAEFGYNKANEWHYVKDGDLPKEEKEYLVIYESDHTKYIGIESYYLDTKEWSTICKIIAWKEIVLPELKESE